MSAILIISIFILVAASYSIICWKRSPSTHESPDILPQLEPRGLFGDGQPLDCRTGEKLIAHTLAAERARLLRERAAGGDVAALGEAHATGDAALYREVLDALVEHADDDTDVLRLVSATIVKSDDLRASEALARKLLDAWARSPERASVFEILRVAALSDDAATFERALTTVSDAHADGRFAGASAGELRALFEAEYWVLSSEAKRSGAGFVLKQRLAEVCRRLSDTARREAPTPTEAGETKASL